MRNKLDLFLKEIGLHLSPLQKKILEKKPLRKKNRCMLYILNNMIETFTKGFLKFIRRT